MECFFRTQGSIMAKVCWKTVCETGEGREHAESLAFADLGQAVGRCTMITQLLWAASGGRLDQQGMLS
jgi:hypothetical protein